MALADTSWLRPLTSVINYSCPEPGRAERAPRKESQRRVRRSRREDRSGSTRQLRRPQRLCKTIPPLPRQPQQGDGPNFSAMAIILARPSVRHGVGRYLLLFKQAGPARLPGAAALRLALPAAAAALRLASAGPTAPRPRKPGGRRLHSPTPAATIRALINIVLACPRPCPCRTLQRGRRPQLLQRGPDSEQFRLGAQPRAACGRGRP